MAYTINEFELTNSDPATSFKFNGLVSEGLTPVDVVSDSAAEEAVIDATATEDYKITSIRGAESTSSEANNEVLLDLFNGGTYGHQILADNNDDYYLNELTVFGDDNKPTNLSDSQDSGEFKKSYEYDDNNTDTTDDDSYHSWYYTSLLSKSLILSGFNELSGDYRNKYELVDKQDSDDALLFAAKKARSKADQAAEIADAAEAAAEEAVAAVKNASSLEEKLEAIKAAIAAVALAENKRSIADTTEAIAKEAEAKAAAARSAANNS